MNYIDTEDRSRKKKLFTALYAGTVLLIVIACTAFLVAPQLAKQTLVQEKAKPKQPAPQIVALQLPEPALITVLTERWAELQDLVEDYRKAVSNQSTSGEPTIALAESVSSKKAALQKLLDSSAVNPADTSTAKLIGLCRKVIVAQLPEPMPVVNAPVSSGNDVSAYETRLRAKDERIKQLQKELIVAGNTVRNATGDYNSESAKDAKFLSWALSSQSLELNKLQKENASLKAQINNLKRQ